MSAHEGSDLSSEYEDCLDHASNDSRRKKVENSKKHKTIKVSKSLNFGKGSRKIKRKSRDVVRNRNEESKQNNNNQYYLAEPNSQESTDSIGKRFRKYSNKSHEYTDKTNESDVPDEIIDRENYIGTLLTLLSLTRPDFRDGNRSKEALENRERFYENRRTKTPNSLLTTENNGGGTDPFATDSFWESLYCQVNKHNNNQIKEKRKEIKDVIQNILKFKIENNMTHTKYDLKSSDHDYLNCFTESYLNHIQSSYEQIDFLVTDYYKGLTYWPTFDKALDSCNLKPDVKQQLISIIETLQAWLTCCDWLSWKIDQLYRLIDFKHEKFDVFVKKYVISQINYFDIADDDIYKIGKTTYRTMKERYRHRSLGSAGSDIEVIHHLDTPNINYDYDDDINEEINGCAQHKLDKFTDTFRKRYGFEKLCQMTVNTVQPLLKKFQELFSILEKDDKMPLTRSFAQVVKKPPILKTKTDQSAQHNNEVVSENIDSGKSENSFTSCGPVYNEQEYPPVNYINNDEENVEEEVGEVEEEKCDIVHQFEEYLENYTKLESDTIKSESEYRGLFGFNNSIAANLNLPPLLLHYLFLAQFPVRCMHSCIKNIIKAQPSKDLSNLDKTTLKEKVAQIKEALKFTLQSRNFFVQIIYGINFQLNTYKSSRSSPALAPPQDIDYNDYIRITMKELDLDLSELLKIYMEYLKEFLNKSGSSIKLVQNHKENDMNMMNERRQLLEQEWKFVKVYCHSIKQEEDIVASSFCRLTVHLFDLLKHDIDDLLKKDTDQMLLSVSSPSPSPNHDLENDFIGSTTSDIGESFTESTTSSVLQVSETCRNYNVICKNLKTRLKQATEFAKLLRSDLEISIHIELNSDTTVNNFLADLKYTHHKLVVLEQPGMDNVNGNRNNLNLSDLNLIIPDECGCNLSELLHQLVTGFCQQIKDGNEDQKCCSPINSCHSSISYNRNKQQNTATSEEHLDKTITSSREYMLVINKHDKINWEGGGISFSYDLDIDTLKQRLETGKILFLARRPDQLLNQLNRFFDQKIDRSTNGSMKFRDIIVQPIYHGSPKADLSKFKKSSTNQSHNVDFQIEACHNNTKRNLSSLKDKIIEFGDHLQKVLVESVQNLMESSKLNSTQMNAILNSILNSYSIVFEFYLDMIRICTGDTFKQTIEIRVRNLLDLWFKYANKRPFESSKCVPKWAGPSFDFLLQIFRSRVIMNMSSKDWKEFKKSLDTFITSICGSKGTSSTSTTGSISRTSNKVRPMATHYIHRKSQTIPDLIPITDEQLSNMENIMKWTDEMPQTDIRYLRYGFSDPNPHTNKLETLNKSMEGKLLSREKQSITANPSLEESSIVRKFQNRKSWPSGLQNDGEEKEENENEDVQSNLSTMGSTMKIVNQRNQKIKELELKLEEKLHANKLIGNVLTEEDYEKKNFLMRRVDFHWVKKKFIGGGNSGKVYQVCILGTNELRAMKEITLESPLSSDSDTDEHELLCNLKHESLVRFYGADISLSHRLIFMEYCDGGTIASVCKNQVDERVIRRWTGQILSAIIYLHDKKIVHRDVKPENIFLVYDEINQKFNTKLGDLGLAVKLKQTDYGWKAYGIKGTYMYMAPEIVTSDSMHCEEKDRGYDDKVDIWSLGCVVLYMLVNEPPWKHHEAIAIYYDLGQKSVPPIPNVMNIEEDNTNNHYRDRTINQEAKDFIVKCLKPIPQDRPNGEKLMDEEFIMTN